MKIIILGAGVAGLASAISLSKWSDEPPSITVVEVRPEPSSIGGAVGLTPNALRCLHHLGVLSRIRKHNYGADIDKIELFTIYTGARLGEIKFTGNTGKGVGDPAFKGLRIMRSDLLQALSETALALDNIDIKYGLKATKLEEDDSRITVTFDNCTSLAGDILIGCDGIHSFVRSKLVDTERTPEYTGIATVFGFAYLAEGDKVPWQDTGLCQSQRGSLMTSYLESTRKQQFIAGVMETADVVSREGWKARGSEQESIKRNVHDRFGNSAIRFLDPLIEATEHWSLYPVYKLAPRGNWASKRAILLGDAAHAMPPQGESTAYALEDAILFARILQKYQPKGVQLVFDAYQKKRRVRMDAAYDESVWGWETQKDCGWLSFLLRTWITSGYLWWTTSARQKRYIEDVGTIDLD
ncbi:hypothetical protein LTR84_007772 [Exophiala bonariae]|uniref:FAD-binding domain-containing protein n=1 Tax=Exophiala bonariae TaxID=1690606 RepID=A0AAV9NQ34_9EURO|nr:hypothetical protein LTR84_007772 [Exophiala bonariae]